jgi:hypothetical protein
MTIDEILDELRYNDEGELPVTALEEAISKKEEIIPELIKIVEYTSEHADECLKDERNYFAHIYALFLLASFKEKRAYKPIIKLFSLPEEVLYNLFDDIIIHYTDIFLYLISNGDDSLIKELILNKNASEFTRAGAIISIKMMYSSGIKTRDEIINYYKYLFSELERVDSLIWIELVTACTELYPEEVYDDIKRAFDDELIDTDFFSMEEVDDKMKKNKEDVIQQDLADNQETLVLPNIIEELEGWMEFGVDYGFKSGLDEDLDDFDEDDDEEFDEDEEFDDEDFDDDEEFDDEDFDDDEDEFDEDDDEFDEDDDEFDDNDEIEIDEEEVTKK